VIRAQLRARKGSLHPVPDGRVGAVDLTIVGVQRLATRLGSAVTSAVHRALPGGSTD
jgi:hypothetical protein